MTQPTTPTACLIVFELSLGSKIPIHEHKDLIFKQTNQRKESEIGEKESEIFTYHKFFPTRLGFTKHPSKGQTHSCDQNCKNSF